MLAKLKNKHQWLVLLLIAISLEACLSRKAPSIIDRTANQRDQEQKLSRNFDKYAQKRILDKIFAENTSCSAQPSGRSEAQLRLLTVREFEWTIQDIFGVEVPLQAILPAEQTLLGFRNNAFYRLLTADHFDAYLRAAAAVSSGLIANNLLAQLNCQQRDLDQSCGRRFLDNYGLQLWRRPLEPQEIQTLVNLYQGESNQAALEQLIQVMLISSQFLYRHEIGQEGRLNPWELASSLSFGIWGSIPDQQLFELARQATILDSTVLATQVERLLNDSKAKRGLGELADAWLGFRNILNVNKDENNFPEFQSATRELLAQETSDFFDHVVRRSSGTFSELFMADYTIGNQQVATYYGGEFVGDQKINLNVEQRRGLLGHASILATYASTNETHPVKRGEFVMEHIFCDIQAPTPAGLEVQVPPPDPNATTRERFAIHTQNPACASCHIKLDGVGFGMEDMDSIGRFRSMENGQAVDASGEIRRLVMQDDQTFQGTSQLSAIIANSRRAQLCYTVHWFRMLHGRFESERDICHIRQIGDDFANKNQSTGELILRLLSHPQYLERSKP